MYIVHGCGSDFRVKCLFRSPPNVVVGGKTTFNITPFAARSLSPWCPKVATQLQFKCEYRTELFDLKFSTNELFQTKAKNIITLHCVRGIAAIL